MGIIKSIGSNGQISIGKEFAGKLVLIEQLEPGVWILKLGEFIPDNERWLHEPETEKRLDEAIEWAKNTTPQATDLEELERRLRNE